MPARPLRPSPLARAVGAGAVLLAVGATVLLVQWIGAEYGFRRLPPLEGGWASDPGALAAYADRMEALLRRDPDNGEMRLQFARALGLLGDALASSGAADRGRAMRERALAELRRARRTLNTQDSLFLEAALCDKLGRTDEALQLMADCVRINPTHLQYNGAYLRMVFLERLRLEQQRQQGLPAPTLDAVREAFALAARNWAIRAPHDPNAYLFLGNYFVDPLFPLQAYRSFLTGLSNPDWMNLAPELLITIDAPADRPSVMRTVRQILDYGFARPYRGLP